jgi:hypothetical protein
MGNTKTAYIYAFFGGFAYFCSQVGRHNGFYCSPIIGAKVRAALI